MHILYGVQATGNGHMRRSVEIIKELKNRGHFVQTLFSGREDNFWDMEDFEPYIIFKGITFKIKNGKIRHLTTVLDFSPFDFYSDLNKLLKTCNYYDLIISDFEPIVVRYAKKKKILSLNISHQSSFYEKIPTKRKEPIGTFIVRNFARADINIGVHWSKFGSESIIPPIIPKDLEDKSIPNKYVVYLPFENTKRIVKIFEKFPENKFYIYAPERFEEKENVFSRDFSRSEFLEDLQEAEGLISNAGFESISEALQIGKKILVKPVKNQMEQESNAKCIEILDLGKATKKITEESIDDFLKNGEKRKLKIPHVSRMIVDWLEEGGFNKTNLVKECWKEV